jgi:hypothetical protein
LFEWRYLSGQHHKDTLMKTTIHQAEDYAGTHTAYPVPAAELFTAFSIVPGFVELNQITPDFFSKGVLTTTHARRQL